MNVKPLHDTGSLQATRSGLTQTKHSRESPCKSDHESLREKFISDNRPDLYAGTPPLDALKAMISIAAHQKETFSIMHIDVPRAYFHAKAQKRPGIFAEPGPQRSDRNLRRSAGSAWQLRQTRPSTLPLSPSSCSVPWK